MQLPIRVLNVVGRMDRGGIETLIMNIYRNIDREKIQFDFLAHYGKVDADYNDEIRSLGGHIYEMPVIKTTTKTYYSRFFSYCRALKAFFSEHQEYQILHGHMTNTAAIYMPIAKKYGNVKCTIAHSHLTETQKTISFFSKHITNLLIAPIRNLATDYFACSEAAALWLFKPKDISSGRVTIINNGVNADAFDYNEELRKKVRLSLGVDDKVVVGHVGRFFPQKNHSYLLDIYAAFYNLRPNSALILVGDGELRQQMEEKVKQLGIENNTYFLGLRSDINELLQGFDLFLMPSLYEGLPVVGVEAQAAGLPLVISSEITRELDITGNIDYVPLSESPLHWAKIMDDKLNKHNRISIKAKIIDTGYDISTTVKFLEDFYSTIHF